MLEQYANQASGLLGLGSQTGPRLIAMVSHGDEHAELPLLWQLCMSFVQLGYSITVLDGTTVESETNPGLEQVLNHSLWPDYGPKGMPAWSVLPSAKGIHFLASDRGAQAGGLDGLYRVCPREGVLALYCSAESMTHLLTEWQADPLLVVSSKRSSLLTGYLALKRLLISGKLKPTIIHMLQDHELRQTAGPVTGSSGLSACAKRFLGYEGRTLDLRVPGNDAQPGADIQSLALRLLENSMTLGGRNGSPTRFNRSPQPRRFDQFAESH